jgi:hypothetical protein
MPEKSSSEIGSQTARPDFASRVRSERLSVRAAEVISGGLHIYAEGHDQFVCGVIPQRPLNPVFRKFA